MVYGLYRSWINGDMHIISNTALQRRRYDPYESYDSYGSWNNGLRVVQLVKCISLERLTVYIQVHDSYDSWNNGSRLAPLVNCIDYILMISNSAELIPPVNDWRDKHATDNAYSSLWKRECPESQNTMNILRSQSVRAEERSIHSSHTNRESREKHAKDNACSSNSFWKGECPNAQSTMNILRSQNVRAH